MPPLVTPLIDTNGDGKVNERDVPAVIVNTKPGNAVTHVVALRGDTGEEIFSIPNTNCESVCAGGPAVGDLDGDGHVEIIVVNPSNGDLNFLNHDGTLQWTINPDGNYNSFPTMFNQDSSGLPEFTHAYWTYNADGTLRWGLPNPALPAYEGGQSRQPVDLDLDGIPEAVAGPSAFDSSGNLLWWWKITTVGSSSKNWTMTGYLNRGAATVQVSAPYPLADAWTAVANLDDDPNPEIIAVMSSTSSDSSPMDLRPRWPHSFRTVSLVSEHLECGRL